MKRIKQILIASSLLLALLLTGGGSSQHPGLLAYQAEAGIDEARNWYVLAKQGDRKARERLTQFAAEHNDAYWLTLASRLRDPHAAYLLAEQQEHPSQRLSLLRQAAGDGHGVAQYTLAMLSQDNQRLVWLQQAASQGVRQAVVALAQWWTLRNEFSKALPWLQASADYHAPSAKALGLYYWKQQQVAPAKKWLRQASSLGDKGAQHTLNVIGMLDSGIKGFAVSRNSCAMTLQFVATSLATAEHAMALQSQFAADKRLSDLAICLNEPVMESELSCSPRWQGAPRLGCDLAPLAKKYRQQAQQFTHLVVVSDEGKANVNNGVMYLDLADSYSVFVHELAHFAGFADEYPVSEGLAEQFCHSWIKAPNLIYVDEGEEPDISPWLSTGESVQVSAARTCNNLQKGQVYKPSSTLTFLEYHDQQKIPAIYLALWRRQLSNAAALVPAYINLAQASEKAGSIEQTLFWQQEYLNFYPAPSVQDNKLPQALH